PDQHPYLRIKNLKAPAGHATGGCFRVWILWWGGARAFSGEQRHEQRFPDMAQKRCRARGVSPTWCNNDVGPEVVPRPGAKTTSGQSCFPDMAQKRYRARCVSPTWHKNDVGSHDDNPYRSPAQPQKNTRSTERVFSQNP